MHDATNGSDGRPATEGSAGDGSALDARSALLALMVGSEGEFRQRAATRLAQLPAYRDVPTDRLDQILDEITWLYQAFLGCLAERRDLSLPEISQIEAIGHSRARQGVPRDVLDNAFRTVLDDSLVMLEDHARQLAVHDTGALEVVSEFSRMLTSLALQTTQAMGRGHGAPDPTSEVPSGDVWLQRTLSEQPATLATEGHDEFPDLVIVLPAGADSEVDPELGAVLDEVVATFGTALAGPIVPTPVPHAVALVGHDLHHTEAARHYDEIARDHHAVVVHGTIAHPDRTVECYRVLRSRLDENAHLTTQPGAISVPELLLTLALATIPQDLAEAFVRSELGPLLASARHDSLLPTIQTYIATDGTLEQTAQKLQVTPKTVRRRLETIATILDRPLDTVQSLARVRMALDLVELHHDRWPQPGDPRWGGTLTTDLSETGPRKEVLMSRFAFKPPVGLGSWLPPSGRRRLPVQHRSQARSLSLSRHRRPNRPTRAPGMPRATHDLVSGGRGANRRRLR